MSNLGQDIEASLALHSPAAVHGTLLNATPVVQSWPQVSVNRTILLKSAAVGRLIEFSVDGGIEYFAFTYDFTSTTSLIVFVKVPVTHIRVTGATNDTWSIL